MLKDFCRFLLLKFILIIHILSTPVFLDFPALFMVFNIFLHYNNNN